MLTRVEIDGFKSFSNFSVDLDDFNLIVGANGSGKSNFFEAMKLLSILASPTDVHEAMVHLRGGVDGQFRQGGDRIRLRATASSEGRIVNNETSIDRRFNKGRIGIFSKSSIDPSEIIDDMEQVLHPGRQNPFKKFTFLDLQPSILRAALLNAKKSDPSQLSSVGEYLPSLLARLQSIKLSDQSALTYLDLVRTSVRKIIPHFKAIDVIDFSNRYFIKVNFGEYKDMEAELLSDGTLVVLALVGALYDPEAQGTFFIEELERAVDPRHVADLVEFIRDRIAESRDSSGRARKQVIVTSHAPALVAACADQPEKIIFAEMSQRRNPEPGAPPIEATRFRKVIAKDRQEAQETGQMTIGQIHQYLDSAKVA